ncbi:hypothetical protein MKW98_007618 [Papaver atlanticum]|uniref:Uncharacterized protein n=1 Tax=Papaver atlanticum TaxID=357466 RepID=A0AAD4XD17_9MAGN|nr:hypothetical protein MKW98_007618 [Papaver atlanticum]
MEDIIDGVTNLNIIDSHKKNRIEVSNSKKKPCSSMVILPRIHWWRPQRSRMAQSVVSSRMPHSLLSTSLLTHLRHICCWHTENHVQRSVAPSARRPAMPNAELTIGNFSATKVLTNIGLFEVDEIRERQGETSKNGYTAYEDALLNIQCQKNTGRDSSSIHTAPFISDTIRF